MEAHGNNSSVVSELLNGSSNYEEWSIQVKAWLLARDLWDVVAKQSRRPRGDEKLKVKAWRRKNAAALHAILISCTPDALQVIKGVTSAKIAWATLADNYGHKSVQHIEIQSRLPVTTEIEKSPIQVEEEPNSGESEPESNPDQAQLAKEGNASDPNVGDFQVYQPLFNAVYQGDWDAARTFLDQNREAIKATAPGSGRNALHVAVSQGHLHIVERLVERMTEQDLEMEDAEGFTSLAVAVHYGYSSIAQCLITKNIRLLSIVKTDYLIPVVHAVLCGQMQTATYLYSVTPLGALTSLDEGRQGAALLRQSINAKRFDIALHLMERAPVLAITDDVPGYSPMGELTSAKLFPCGCSLIFWQKWIYDSITVPNFATNQIFVDIQNLDYNQDNKRDITIKCSGVLLHCREAPSSLLRWMVSNLLELLDIKKLHEMKLVHVQSRELLSRVCKVIKSTSDAMQLKKAGVSNDIMLAASEGNVEFIKSIANANPELVWNSSIARGMFKLAIEARQASVFSLIYGLPDKVALASYIDLEWNNMVHKAALVAPSRLLNLIPGAALQMQRELQWFKEVESVAAPRARTRRNKEGLTPREIFSDSHKKLVIAGEKWMKDTSSSCTVVGALIITVTFAAAFTFPGGNDQNTGYPIFANRKLFNVFMISNAIALFNSSTSVLMFLGILTSRYAEEDFLKSLPKKLIIGLSTLFLSMATMIVAFCAGLSIIFREELWIVIPSVCLASIPIAFFARMQFPLLVDILMSTYGPSIFNRNVKRWI